MFSIQFVCESLPNKLLFLYTNEYIRKANFPLCRSDELEDHDASPDEESAANLVVGANKDNKIPYDLSISSENDVTNDELKSGEDQACNSEGSLHDSMEILEEVATEDHFDNDLPIDDDDDASQESDEVDQEPKDIFEMPPMPENFVENQNGTPPPPPAGGQEFIF